jgi:hypothetical protein
VTVLGDKTDFEMPITVPKESAARTLPNVTISVALADGKVSVTQPLALTVAPPAAAPTPKKK